MICPQEIIEAAEVSASVKEAAYDLLPTIEDWFGDFYVSPSPDEGSITFSETESMDTGMSFVIQDNC